MGRATEYPVVLDVDDWLMIDPTMDDELDRLSQEGWDYDDWGEPSRDPHWAELSELGLSVRQAGWAQVPEQRNRRRTADEPRPSLSPRGSGVWSSSRWSPAAATRSQRA
jgi:hypothetical protein